MAGGAGNVFPSLMALVAVDDHGWNADIIARNVDPCSGHVDGGDELSSLLLRLTRSGSPSTIWKKKVKILKWMKLSTDLV